MSENINSILDDLVIEDLTKNFASQILKDEEMRELVSGVVVGVIISKITKAHPALCIGSTLAVSLFKAYKEHKAAQVEAESENSPSQ